jgi:DNA mismatch endonuclease (patch repair protein)
MQAMPSRDSKPELRLRRELHRRGLRYRLHVQGLPGRPDVAFTAAKIAVFVDGCFWHGCPQHGRQPAHNSDWWRAKIGANKRRDRRNARLLRAAGWSVVRVWEHEDPARAADRIARMWGVRRT